MFSRSVKILFILITILFVIIGLKYVFTPKPTQTNLPFDKLELANTDETRAKGMMFRQNVCQKCGILFVFPDSQVRTFWMKNTFISLDMIFIDSQGKVVSAYRDTQPNQTQTVYSSIYPAKYVLEFPSGYIVNQNIQINSQVNLQNLLQNTKPFDNSYNQN